MSHLYQHLQAHLDHCAKKIIQSENPKRVKNLMRKMQRLNQSMIDLRLDQPQEWACIDRVRFRGSKDVFYEGYTFCETCKIRYNQLKVYYDWEKNFTYKSSLVRLKVDFRIGTITEIVRVCHAQESCDRSLFSKS